MENLIQQIEAELERLDAADSDTNSSGICVYADETLPKGWVRVSDGSATVYDKAEDVLASLKAVEYDADKVVGFQSNPIICYDKTCYGGELPEDAEDLHVHDDRQPIFQNGWELAWEAIGGEEYAPENSRTWPEDLIAYEQIEEGEPNDNPVTVVKVETNGGTRFTCGCHGANCCALDDAFKMGGAMELTREAAIERHDQLAQRCDI
jgi:hypothetical protein